MADFIPKQYTKEPITIRIAPDKLAQIDAFAAKFNMSRSEFINQCIDYALNHLPHTQTRPPPRSFFVTRRAQQHRARMQSAAMLPSHAPHGSKARLIVVPNRRDSWRSHVHRTRFGKHCSSSSYKPAMSGVEGEGPSSLSLGGCKGGCSLSSEREQPPFCALPRGAGDNFTFY